MSVKAQNWVWEHSRAEGTDLLVALAIADRANDDGEDAWPNMETLCRKTRLSRSTVSRSVRNLEDLSELRVDRELGKRNCYVLTMPHYEDNNRCQSDTGRPANVAKPSSVNLTPVSDPDQCQPDTGRNLAPVSAVTPPPVSPATPQPVSLLTHKTSCTSGTSSTHTPRTRADARQQGSLIGRGESVGWAKAQDQLHRGCHPEVCKWRGTTRGICLPALLVPKFAEKLIGVEPNAAIADVIAWAQRDTPPPGSVADGDDFKFWRERWGATRSTAKAAAKSAAPRTVPGVAETDALIAEMTGGRVHA
jgi:hypothetical protein